MVNNSLYVSAVILAGGCGSRMENKITKQRIELLGESVLKRCVRAFVNCPKINSIVVVCREDELEWAAGELECFGGVISAIVPGGKTRAESAKAGFFAIPKESDFVAIHDSARCLVTAENIAAIVDAAAKYGAASAATAITDTQKLCDENGFVIKTVDRNNMFSVQTPQIFDVNKYGIALKSISLDDSITDDNMLMEKIGERVFLVDTGRQNIKITRPEDIAFAEYIIERRESMQDIRVGHGYDVHRLTEGRALVLGGVTIPHSLGLLGHSDADVLTHAIMDALLGAAGLGDIGRHFPDTDDSYKGISSLELLSRVADLLSQNGYSVSNIDATLVLQKPKIAPYIDLMVTNLSKNLGIEQGRINIKATTEEKLGFTGREEGISAHEVAIIKKG